MIILERKAMEQEELSFSDTERAFIARSNAELRKANWLFRLMGSSFLVKIFSKLTLIAIKIGIPVRSVIKHTIFNQFCGGETLEESKSVVEKLNNLKVGSILDYSVEGKDRDEDFIGTAAEVNKIIELASINPAIPYTSVKLSGLMPAKLLEKVSGGVILNAEEQKRFKEGKERIDDLCRNAGQKNVPVYFDAEETWVQSAIDSIAEEMMKKYNKQRAIVLTTLQMYRWDRMEYLEGLLKNAREEGYSIGIKLVRGAYMERENARASIEGRRSPIHSTKVGSDIDFDKAVELCLRNIDIVTLCAGTHNEKSTLYLVQKMKELGIPNDHKHVYFSQLYGMSDHITYNLAHQGYNVTKYLPYGPVRSVVPYLIRRAEENTGIAGQMGRELMLIVEERNRRKEQQLLPPAS